jgi:hypothetical protein
LLNFTWRQLTLCLVQSIDGYWVPAVAGMTAFRK